MQNSGLMSLEIVRQLNKISIDTKSIIKKYRLEDNNIDSKVIIRIAKDEGFKVKYKKLSVNVLNKYPLPCIIPLNDKEYMVLLKRDKENNKYLVFDKNCKSPVTMSFEEIEKISEKEIIILKHKQSFNDVNFGFKWFYNQIMNYKKIVGEILIVSFIIQLFGLITPLFTQVILDKVLVHQTISTLNVIAVAFLAVALFEFILNLSRNYIFVHTTSKIDSKLGSKLFWHLISLPLTYFENRKVGNIIARVRELDQIREFIANKSVTLLLDVMFSFVFVFMMFLYSPKLAFITIGFVFVIGLIYFFITPELRKRLENKFQMGARSNSYLVESVTGMQTVKSLAIEGGMQKKWEENLSNYVESNFKLTNLSNILSALSGVLQKLMTLAILYFGVGLVIGQELTVGQLIAFQMFANQFSGPIMRLVGLWNEFQQTLLSVDRLGDILNSPVENSNKKAITLPKLNGNVLFKDISFKYKEGGTNVLNNFNLEVKEGESIGIVGRSGSGKSTLTKLIQRLYVRNEGAIYVDGIDIRHMNPSWLRQNIGVVLQENYLFSGTIRENIEYSLPGCPMERILNVSKIAGADEFISEFPEGYDTVIEERGSSLSGGQRQRVAIARALINKPKVLFADEPTGNLDSKNSLKVFKLFQQLSKEGITVIVATHDKSLAQLANRIIEVKDGQIQ